MKKQVLFALASLAALTCTGCLMVGYRTGQGWSVWPGGFGLIVLIVIVLLLARRRR